MATAVERQQDLELRDRIGRRPAQLDPLTGVDLAIAREHEPGLR
jgi:hypothetical protein